MKRLAVLILTVATLAAPAAAHAELPGLLAELSPEGSATGSGAGEFHFATGIATNPDNGHIYVTDRGNFRIEEFTPWGVFVRAFGWGVDTGAAEFETCTTSSGCQAGIPGGGNGQFTSPNGIAIDSAGDLYVTDWGNLRVEKFDSEGNFLLAWGGDVVAQGPGDSGQDEVQELVIAATAGTFKLSFRDPLGDSATATTAPLPFNATAAQVEAALNGLATVASHGGSVSVSGGPGDGTGSSPYLIGFEGSLAGDDVPQLQVDRGALGVPAAGSRLVCSTDTHEVETYEYAWLRNGQPIPGATAPTYVTTPEDAGKAIQCQVFAINPNTGEVAISVPAHMVPPSPATAPPVPVNTRVDGGFSRLSVGSLGGEVITCDTGSWQNATSFSYRWYRNGVQIAGAVAPTYELKTGDLATRAAFQCVATGANAGGSVAAASGWIATNPVPTPPPPSASLPSRGTIAVSLEPVRTLAQGGGPEICRAAAGDACKAGEIGRADGQFLGWPLSSIDTGPGDIVYVGDGERIQKFEPDGAFKSQIALPGRTVYSLSVAPSGQIYVGYANLISSPPEPNAYQLDSSGELIRVLELGGTAPNGATAVGRPLALATDSAGNVYVAAGISDGHNYNQVLQFDPAGNALIPFGSYFPLGDSNTGAEFRGIATNGVGDVLVQFFDGDSFNLPPGEYLNIYGPGPIAYEPPPPADPEIVEQFAAKAGVDAAEVRAVINPNFWPDATYYVEYGTDPCEGGGCAETAPVLLTDKSLKSGLLTAPVKLSGLQEGTVYHYRFVAESGGGGPVLGPEQSFRTYRAAPASLPDGRAFELVSPINKDGGEVGTPGAASGGAEFSVQPLQAAPSGKAITYTSFTSFGQGGESAPAASQYLSRPLAGGLWQTANINPRFEAGFTRGPFVGFSEDLAHGAVIAIEPPLTADAIKGFPALYVRDNGSGELTAITTEAHEPQFGFANKRGYCLFFGGASADFDRVYFGANGALEPGDPVPPTELDFNLYEWSPSGGVQLASVLPDGTPAAPGKTNFGGSPAQQFCLTETLLMRHAVSAEGSKAFWTYDGSYEGAENPLFARLDGGQTVRLDKPNEGVAGAGGGGRYQDASADGTKVFFTTTKKLTAAPTKIGFPDLYRYDFEAPAGNRLEDLTPHTPEPANVQGVLGASADGSYVYFVAEGVLDTGANGEGETALAGASNLYAWHEGEGVRFLLRGVDAGPNPVKQTARLAPDGRHLAFLAGARAYLYDYEADVLTCASCNAAATKPLGAASLPGWSTPYQGPRYLSADGGRLFFQTLDRLSPNDENEEQDVYEFELPGRGSCTQASPAFNADAGGCQFLISSGQSDEPSYFLDASESGEDAFFSTREGLVYGDSDGRYDVHDARVGGSSPQPPPPSCEGEACRGPASAPPAAQTPGSLGFRSSGNPRPPRCRKGTHLVTRKGKARCVKNKRKHHRQGHRATKHRP
jgi:hypothetical protein